MNNQEVRCVCGMNPKNKRTIFRSFKSIKAREIPALKQKTEDQMYAYGPLYV